MSDARTLDDSTVDDALQGLSQDRAVTLIVEHVASTDGDVHEWVLRVGNIVERNSLPPVVLRRCVNALAWRDREQGHAIPSDAVPEPPESALSGRRFQLAWCYARAARLRYDFRFDQLLTWTRWARSEFPDDGFLTAYATFAALGSGAPQAHALLAAVRKAPDQDRQCRALMLHGLWITTSFPDSAQLAVDLADDAISRGEDEPNHHYWRAGALRRLGRLDEALQSVDLAIDLLPSGNNAVHQDYFREREYIVTTKALDERVEAVAMKLTAELEADVNAHLDAARGQMDEQHARARELVSESLIGIIEVLAIFVTLAGFIIGSGTLLIRADGFWQYLAAISVLLLGCVALFTLLRVVVRGKLDVVPGIARKLIGTFGQKRRRK